MKRPGKRWFAFGAFFVYAVIFIVLWLGGGYVINASGRTRADFPIGFTLSDIVEWQPWFGVCQPAYQWPGPDDGWTGGDIKPRCDLIGWAYYPMWLIVKKRHPTYAIIDSSLPYEVIDPDQLPAEFKFHPHQRNELENLFEQIREASRDAAELELNAN